MRCMDMRKFVITHDLSLWLLIASLVISAVMMRPGLAALIAIGLNAIILIIMRKSAKIEGESGIIMRTARY